MKEFILPEKWCIRQNADQKVCKWFNENTRMQMGSNLRCHLSGGYKYLTYNGKYSDYNNVVPHGYTEITFDQFKQYVLKQKPEKMKKQDFTIEGSVALKKAFIEECGVGFTDQNTSFDGWLIGNYAGILGFKIGKEELHFNLNTQYGEALEYVKEYFKPEVPEFKVGDWICVLGIGVNDSRHENYKNIATKGDFIQITGFSESTFDGKKVAICDGGYVVYIEQYPEDFRHVTPEEIEEYNNTKLPKINGYEGHIEHGCVNYGCKIVSFKDIKRLQKVWQMFFRNVNEKELILDSDKFKIKKSELDQIIKVVNAKTK